MPITIDEIAKGQISTGNDWLDSVLLAAKGYNFSFASLTGYESSLSYSFSPPKIWTAPDAMNGRDSLVVFNSSQQIDARSALAYIADLTGIQFIETTSDEANLFFYNADIILGDNYSSTNIRYEYDTDFIITNFKKFQTDIIFDTDSGLRDLSPGTYGYERLLISLGWSLGIKRHTESVVLDEEFDDAEFTILSSARSGSYKREFGSIDKAALAFLYGGDGIGGEYGYYADESYFEVTAGFSLVASDSDDLIVALPPEPTSHLKPVLYNGGSGNDLLRIDIDRSDFLLSQSPMSQDIIVMAKNGAAYRLINIESLEAGGNTVDLDNIKYLGDTSFDYNSLGAKPVYEFYNNSSNAYFYTADLSERNTIIARSSKSENGSVNIQSAESLISSYSETVAATNAGSWSYFYQGSSFNAASSIGGKTTAIHRFYNVDTGHHLWSIDPNEIALIKSKWESGAWPYRYEGTSFYVYSADPDTNNSSIGEEVFRLYNSDTGRHFYSADTEEVGLMQLTGQWSLEGVAFWGE